MADEDNIQISKPNNQAGSAGGFVNPLAQQIKRQPPTPPATPPTPPAAPPTPPAAPVPAPTPAPQPAPTPAPQPPVSQRPQPVPPPPPLTGKIGLSNGASASNDEADLPQSFAMPTEEEIKREQQRQREAGEVKVEIPVPPAPTPMPPTPAPMPPTPAPTSESNAPSMVNSQATNSQTVLNKPFSKNPKPPEITPPTKLEPQRPIMQPERLQQAPVGVPVPTPTALNTPPPPVSNKPDIMLGDEGSSKKRWLWPVLIGTFAIFIGLLWFLQSSGIIYAGWLAGIAGGLPRDPGKALAVIQNKANSLGSYEYESNMAVSFSSSIPELGADSTSIIPDASGTISGQVDGKTIRSDYSFILGSEYPVSTLGGVAVINDDNATMFIDTLSLLEPENNWRRIPRAETDNYALMLPLLQLDVIKLLKNASNGEFVGKSTLGENETALTYVYDLAPLIKSTDANIQEGRLTVWVSKKDGRIIIAQADTLISTDIGIVLLQLQSSLSKHGEAQVENVDTEAIVEAGTVKAIYEGLGVIPTEVVDVPVTVPVSDDTTSDPVLTNANDTQRVTDLNSIASALEAYKKVYGLYPIARELSKSTTTNNVLSSNIVDEGFLSALPQDPAGGSYYYGYKSDGQGYTLTSIIEDATFEGAKQGNGFYYQELTK